MSKDLHSISLRRAVVILALAFWLGGLAFYSAVVIPAAQEVLGSHTQVGFITRDVTGWINLIAVFALSILALNVVQLWRRSGPEIVVAVTWFVMAAIQVSLHLLHPALDRLLDSTAHVVLDGPRFYRLHRVYLLGVTAQLFTRLVHIWYVLKVWRRNDQEFG